MIRCPPVLICGFNRPDCLRQVFESVRKARPEHLFLALDYPRENRPDDIPGWTVCREIFDGVDWPCEVLRNYAELNMGCRFRMGSAITWFFEHVEAGIIFEDDCVPSQSMFSFCAEMLDRYAEDERIGGVCGFIEHWKLPRLLKKLPADYYFDRLLTCWGWATWRRSWQKFDADLSDWPKRKDDPNLWKFCRTKLQRTEFERRFQELYDNKINSWATAWSYSCLKNNLSFIHPRISLVRNVGSAPNATHSVGERGWYDVQAEDFHEAIKHPAEFDIRTDIEQFVIKAMYAPTWFSRTKARIARKIFGK